MKPNQQRPEYDQNYEKDEHTQQTGLQEKAKRGGIFGLNKINLLFKNPIYNFPSEG